MSETQTIQNVSTVGPKIPFHIPENCPINIKFLESNKLSAYELLDQIEVFLILDALKKTNYNNTKAAELLKMNRTTFQMKLYKVSKFNVPEFKHKLNEK